MSFYGSDSTRNNVTQQQQQQHHHQQQQSQLDSNLWSDQSLDPLSFQHPDQTISQMNATLQRQTPSSSQIDPIFNVPRTTPSEFQSYPSNQQDNNHLVFDIPGSTPFNSTRIEQQQFPPRPQTLQNQNNMLQTQLDRPTSSFQRYNINSIPNTSFHISQGIRSNTSLPNYSLSKSSNPDILSSFVEKLLEFHCTKRKAIKDNSNRNAWQAVTSNFFMPNAKLKVDIISNKTNIIRTLCLPIETLPRIWASQYDETIKEETIFIENARSQLISNCVVVECENTLILSTYENRTIQTTGSLKVFFHESKRILSWEFKCSNHLELFNRKQFATPNSFNEYAIPNTALRMMYIADAIYHMNLKLENKTRQQLSHTQQQSTNGPLPIPITNQANLATERFAEQIHAGNMKGSPSASAYGVLLSTGLDPNLIPPQFSQFDSVNMSRPAGMRLMMENGDQIGSENDSRLFDDPINAPLQQDNNMKNNSQAELSQNSRVDSKIPQMNSRRHTPSAVDAANALARGQVGLGQIPKFTERKSGPGGLSYQLIGSCSDESLRVNGSMAMGGPNASGQSTPAGLKIFEPNTNARDSNVGRSQYPRSNSRGLKRGVSGEPRNTNTNAPNRGEMLSGKQDVSEVNHMRKPSSSKGGNKSNRELTNSVPRRTSMGRSASPNTNNNRDKRQKSVNSKPD